MKFVPPIRNYCLLVVVSVFSLSQCTSIQEKIIYETNTLKVLSINQNLYVHKSYLQTESFGNVGCNGLVYTSGEEAIVFDTPTNDSSSYELISWIQNHLKCKIKAVVIGHYHDDCLGGLNAFHNANISSIATAYTIELAKKDSVVVPLDAFESKKVITVDSNEVIIRYFGEGHTRDNIVSFIPSENTLFGGCLIKSLKSGEGYTAEGNVAEWSNTVQKIKDTYGSFDYVIPGHGSYGDVALLDFTIEMFEKYRVEK